MARHGDIASGHDPDREFGYIAGAEAAIGQARAQDWTGISMKNDWRAMFTELPG